MVRNDIDVEAYENYIDAQLGTIRPAIVYDKELLEWFRTNKFTGIVEAEEELQG